MGNIRQAPFPLFWLITGGLVLLLALKGLARPSSESVHAPEHKENATKGGTEERTTGQERAGGSGE